MGMNICSHPYVNASLWRLTAVWLSQVPLWSIMKVKSLLNNGRGWGGLGATKWWKYSPSLTGSHASEKKKKKKETPHLQTEVISEQEISNPFHSTMPYGDSYLACVIRMIFWWSGFCGKILIAHSLKLSFALKENKQKEEWQFDNLGCCFFSIPFIWNAGGRHWNSRHLSAMVIVN